MSSDPPTAFISYAWESEDHREWVRLFATRLRADGIDAKIDLWETVHGDQLPAFMERAIRENDFILIVCTPKYRSKSEHRIGGVGYEGDIITAELLNGANQRKFIPILRGQEWSESAPGWLKGKRYADFRGSPYSELEYHQLRSTLHGFPPSRPPLGPTPDFTRASGVDERVTSSPAVINSICDAVTFKQRSQALVEELERDEQVSLILNGVYLPIALPKCAIGDYGRVIEETFLPPVEKAYTAQYPRNRFDNRMAGKLAGKLALAHDSRQQILISRMAFSPVVGLLFPVAYQGFSVLAAREVMDTLPDGFVLAGVLECCVAMVIYADVLATDHAPTLVCAGTTWQNDIALCFHPGKSSMSFGVTDEASAIGSFSPGLLYIGKNHSR